MSDDKKRDRELQRRVRERQAKTGESYQAAWRQLTGSDAPAEDEPQSEGTTIDKTRIEALAAGVDFRVTGYDEVSAAIEGHGQTFFGPHPEVLTYLTAWAACASVGAEQMAKTLAGQQSPFQRTVLSMCTSTPIPAGASAQITTRPQRPFRGERIAIPDYLADRFTIQDVRVGHRAQTPQAGDIPGAAFACRLSEQAVLALEARAGLPIVVHLEEAAVAEFGRELHMDVTQLGMEIVMVVTNISVEETSFQGFIVGKILGF